MPLVINKRDGIQMKYIMQDNEKEKKGGLRSTLSLSDVKIIRASSPITEVSTEVVEEQIKVVKDFTPTQEIASDAIPTADLDCALRMLFFITYPKTENHLYEFVENSLIDEIKIYLEYMKMTNYSQIHIETIDIDPKELTEIAVINQSAIHQLLSYSEEIGIARIYIFIEFSQCTEYLKEAKKKFPDYFYECFNDYLKEEKGIDIPFTFTQLDANNVMYSDMMNLNFPEIALKFDPTAFATDFDNFKNTMQSRLGDKVIAKIVEDDLSQTYNIEYLHPKMALKYIEKLGKRNVKIQNMTVMKEIGIDVLENLATSLKKDIISSMTIEKETPIE
jgi:hypothetical protein